MDEKNIPVSKTGIINLCFQACGGYVSFLSTLFFAVAALFIFFFCNERFEKHNGSCFSLGTLNALENMNQFYGCIITLQIGWK
ncbi:MAG TPA: hypothetical protein VF918_17355 [Anaerolineales bacterium]